MKFSILMSVYNEEKLMGSALENLIKQIRKYGVDAEILVGIDGDDRTDEIARSYIKKFRKLGVEMRVYKFAERKGRTKTMNFLIEKAKGEILINHDPDRLLRVNLNTVENLFRDKKIGAPILEDSMTRDVINKGQKVLEENYVRIKLNKYLKGNVAIKPEFQAYIFRRSALRKPAFKTTQDDTEVVYNLMKDGYKVVYVKDIACCLPDNPRMPKLTISGIMKRRVRGELFRHHAKNILKTDRYSGKSHSSDFLAAILLTMRTASISQLLSVFKYLIIIFVAITSARLRLIFEGTEQSDGWQMKYRVKR